MYKQYNVVAENFPHIPQEAFLFVPKRSNDLKQKDDFRIGQGKSIRRLLFEGWAQQTYTPYELEKLQEFQQYLEKKKIELDPRWDKSWKMRWLLSTGCNHKKTIEDMESFINYQNNLKNIRLTNHTYQRLSKGIFYIGGRDCHYRPMLIFDVAKLAKLQCTDDDIIETITFFFQYIMKNVLIPGQVENWISIIDCGYTGLTSFVTSVRKPMSMLSDKFRSRMLACYVVQIPMSLSFFWGIVKTFLEEETIRKFNFFDQSIIQPLLQYCNPSQLEQKFGGTLKNIETFWPPRQVSDKYQCQKHPTKLLTKQQYTDLYNKKVLRNTKIHQQNIVLPPTAKQIIHNKNTPILKRIQKQLKIQLQEVVEESINHKMIIKPFTEIKPPLNYSKILQTYLNRNNFDYTNNTQKK